jgi:hypothetical protein
LMSKCVTGLLGTKTYYSIATTFATMHTCMHGGKGCGSEDSVRFKLHGLNTAGAIAVS